MIAHAAQLVYIDEKDSAFRLLTAADRLLRHVGSTARRSTVTLSQELKALEHLLEISAVLDRREIKLELDADAEQASSTFVPAGRLVEAALTQLEHASQTAAFPESLVVRITDEPDGSTAVHLGCDNHFVIIHRETLP